MYELPIRMASLQIKECEMVESVIDDKCPTEHIVNNEVPSSPTGRVLRKRISAPHDVSNKRRCKLLPKKYSVNGPDGEPKSLEDLATLYTNKGGSGSPPFKCLLETIYEEPLKQKNGSLITIGIRKIKRTITFPAVGFVSKTKQRTRKAKSKLLCNKWKLIRGGKNRETLDSILAKLETDNSEDLGGS